VNRMQSGGHCSIKSVKRTKASRSILSLIFASIFLVCACLHSQSSEPTNAKESAIKQQAGVSEITPEMLAAEAARKSRMMPDELAWEQTLEANLGSYYLPLYYKDKAAGLETAWDYVKDDPALPRLLIIGDSISRGYTSPARHDLKGRVNVHRAPANCGPTAAGLQNLNVWLGDGKWDVITWNFGIHDRNTDPAVYKTNLEILLRRLQQTGAKIIWVRTTPAPLSGTSAEQFTDAECDQLNRVADEVMKANSVPEIDLYTLLKPQLSELQLANSVHFTEAGYDSMGAEVARTVLSVMKSK
jgi:lysophospholipase L1-like esterase